jgi:putative transposase
MASQCQRCCRLALKNPPRWGGRRDGAGRKRGENPRLRHRSRESFGKPVPAHVTLRLRPRLLSLRTVKLVHEIERSFADGCERGSVRLVHYSLHGNHAHLIVEARDTEALGRGMKAIGSRLARAVNRVMERSGPVWSIATVRAIGSLLDPASSARWFSGWKRSAPGAPEPPSQGKPSDRPAVARARTWLLNVGWRRYGLLDPDDVPG